jgi:hypothetical protein
MAYQANPESYVQLAENIEVLDNPTEVYMCDQRLFDPLMFTLDTPTLMRKCSIQELVYGCLLMAAITGELQ